MAKLIDDMMRMTPTALCNKDLRVRALALLEDLTLALRAEESAREARELAEWRAWVARDAGGGARNAHLYSREPDEWQPTEVATARGTISSDPHDFLQAMRETYKEKWAAVNTQYYYDWGCGQGLTRLTPGELRSSSMEFRTGTTQTYDGFHVRHFALLCDDALDALSHLLLAVEMTGRWPSQIGLVPMPLIPKPKGGYRGIGILPGLYRLWAKARRPMAEAWERDNPRGYLAAATGNGALDAVWRKAARQEAGVGAGSVAASTLDDLESFYESLSRDRLLEEAMALNFPLPIARACLAMYAGPRMLLLQGQAARELHPTRGIIAGCAIATTLVKVYYMRAFDKLVEQLPEGVDLEVYIDDVVLSADGDPGKVVSALADARAKLLRTVTDDLECKIAAGKTAVVATNKVTTARLADACGIPAAATAAAVDLGVDITGAKPRSALSKGTKRRARAEAAVRRRARLRRLAAVIGRRATKIYTAGIAPAGLYDSAIWGMDDGELLKSRRMAAETLRPKGRGRSLTALMLLNAMPTAKLEVAPAVQYGRMVWRAVAARDAARRRRTALPDIDAWWRSAHGYFASTAAAIRSKAASAGGGGFRATRKLWATARGPIAAAAFTLARIGWDFEAPFTIRDDLGREVVLTRTSPRMLRDMLVDGVKRAAERTLAAKWGIVQDKAAPRRLCADIAAAAAKGQRLTGYTPVQIGAFRSAACNAVMTNQRAHQGGYDVDDVCPLCGAVGDTVHHRVYRCSATCQTVKAKVPRWFWEEAQRSDPRDRFWVTAIFPHPEDLAARPAADVLLQFSRGAVGDEAAEAEGPAGTTVEGEIYIDGSCTTSTISGLARAGCAIVQMQGLRVVKKALAAVPDYMPQTAQAAEHLGMALAYRYVEGPSNLIGDCLGVVKALNATMASMLAKGRRYAGLMADTLRDPGRRRLVQSVRWVKAHRTHVEGMSEQEAMDVAGNNAADAAAKEAVKLHPRPGDEATRSIDFYEPRAWLVARAVAAALPMFPPATGSMNRRQRHAAEQATDGQAGPRHQWRHEEGAWRCRVCATWTVGADVPDRRRRETCAGPAADEAGLRALGHRPCRATGALPFTFCSRCGAWAARRSSKLSKPCVPPTQAGLQALKRIERGLHPWRRKERGGREAPRSGIVVTEVHDSSMGIWRGVQVSPAAALPSGGEVGPPPRAPEVAGAAQDGASMVVGARMAEDEVDDDPFGFGGDLDQPDDYVTMDDGHRVKRRRVSQQGSSVSARSEAAPTGCGSGGVAAGTSSATAASAVVACAAAPAVAAAASAAEEGLESGQSTLQGTALHPASAAGRDPRLAGVSESALIAAMQAIMSRRSAGREHPFGRGRWGVYNAVTNEFVVAAIDDIEAERMAHYEAGLRERAARRAGSPAHHEAAGDPPALDAQRAPAVGARRSEDPVSGSHADGPPRSVMEDARPVTAPLQDATRASNVNVEGAVTFATRAELLRHLSAVAARTSGGRMDSSSHLRAGQPGGRPRPRDETPSQSTMSPLQAGAGHYGVEGAPEAEGPRAPAIGAPHRRDDRLFPEQPHKRRRLGGLDDTEALDAAAGTSGAAAGGLTAMELCDHPEGTTGADAGAAWQIRGKRLRTAERQEEGGEAKRGRGSTDTPPPRPSLAGGADEGQAGGARRGHLPRPPEPADGPHMP